MQHGLVGVIVPIYKVEKYIAECIESILAQTYTNFRLILVDDGSPDNAGYICDEYAKKDSRITVIHQENAGVTRARARGVEEAHDCEFIMFVDGDDTITTDALMKLNDRMSKDCDIVIGVVKGYNYYNVNSITNEQYLHSLISRTDISPAPWAKLFRLNLFSKNIFDIPRHIIYGEDLLMNIRLGFKAKNINILKEHIYCYRNNIDGCENTFSTSPEYENSFSECLLSSIPVDEFEKYHKDTIKRNILILETEIGYKYRPNKNWFGSNFQTKLLADISQYKYRYPLIKELLLKIKNPILRYFLISIVKVNNIIK